MLEFGLQFVHFISPNVNRLLPPQFDILQEFRMIYPKYFEIERFVLEGPKDSSVQSNRLVIRAPTGDDVRFNNHPFQKD